MNLPKVSIVIPVYNAEEFVSTSLESVAALSYPTDLLEVIVIDDGSTDNTACIVNKFLNQIPIRGCFLQQENCGPSSARNRGWKYAIGEWIQFLDADDSIEPEKLKIQLSGSWVYDASVALVYSMWRRVWAQNGSNITKEQNFKPLIEGDNVISLLRSENFIQIASCIIRKSWLETVGGFNEAHQLIEDVDLFLRLAMEGACFTRVSTNAPQFTYNQRIGSLSNDGANRKLFIDSCVRNARMVEDYWKKEKQEINEAMRTVLVNVYSNALRYYAGCDVSTFESLCRRLLVLSPKYQPAGGLPKYLTPLIGYPNAELLSARLRKIMGRKVV